MKPNVFKLLIISILSFVILGCSFHSDLKPSKIEDFNKKISLAKNKLEKLKIINDYVNSFEYISDKQNYNQMEYWADIKEFYSNNGGDCEDYAMAKMRLLLENGFEENEVYLVLGDISTFATILSNYIPFVEVNNEHVILLYNDEGKHYLLDNNLKNIVTSIEQISMNFQPTKYMKLKQVYEERTKRNSIDFN